MNWDDLRHFAALAKAGSLSAAARQLGVEHATVARRILLLQESLGLELVDRRGKAWQLTVEGRRIAALAEEMEKQALAIARRSAAARPEIGGIVTISAPPVLAAKCLTAPLAALRQEHPALILRLIGEARQAHLSRNEADIALRLSRPEAGDVIMSKIGTIPFRLYAHKDYLARHAAPDWRFIGSDGEMGEAPQQAALENFAAGRGFALCPPRLIFNWRRFWRGQGLPPCPISWRRARAL